MLDDAAEAQVMPECECAGVRAMYPESSILSKAHRGFDLADAICLLLFVPL